MKSLQEIQDHLNSIVIGQEEAVKNISIAVYKYLMKLRAKNFGIYFDSATSLLLLGNTGVGKTYLAKTLANFLSCDFVEINAKDLAQGGSWHGKSLTDHLEKKLPYNSTDAIVFIDEFDKLLVPNCSSAGDDVNYHIQCNLLKYIEGQELRGDEKRANFNTRSCLFIFAGAFVGLKTEPQKQIGYEGIENKGMSLYDALIDFGMLPEMAGRIQSTSRLRDLTERDYYSILDSDSFIYNQYRELLRRMGVVEGAVRKELVKKAIKKKLGVRGLIQEVEEHISNIMSENIINMKLDILVGVESPRDITDYPLGPPGWWNPKSWKKEGGENET